MCECGWGRQSFYTLQLGEVGCLKKRIALFLAWHSESVAERESVSFLCLFFFLNNKPSAEQNNAFPRFLSERRQFPFFIAPDSAPIFDKGCKSFKIADVSNLSKFFPFNQTRNIKLNPPFLFPGRLITQREKLLCARFITVLKSCPAFFYFTGRALLQKRLLFVISTTYPISLQSGQRS